MTWNSGPFDTEIDHDFDIIAPSEHLTCVNIVCTLVKIKIKIKTFALLNQNPKNCPECGDGAHFFNGANN